MTKEDALIVFTRNSSDGNIVIRLEDKESGIRFLEVEIPPDNFSRALVGSQFVGCQYELESKEVQKLGKVRETRTVRMRKEGYKCSEEQIKEHFLLSGLPEEGWEITSTGTHRQQENPGLHEYTVCRWVF